MGFDKINLFKGKKGISDEVFFNIFELILAMIVIVSLLKFINDVSEQTIFEKNYLARDMALLINTLYTAPGDVSYIYNEDTANFKFIYGFMPNKVEVYEKEEALQQNHPFYPFAENKKIKFGYDKIEYKEDLRIRFSKGADEIGIAEATTADSSSRQ